MSSNYYSLKKIKSKQATYNIIFGERSNGKTHAVLDEIVQNYCKTGKQGAILRRWSDDFKQKRGASFFNGLVDLGLIKKYSNGEFDQVVFKSMQWFLARYDNDTCTYVLDNKPFCYGFSLNSMEHDKSTSFPNITTILFDEMLTRSYYLPDEFVLFMNCISTIVRQRDDVVIYMLGNTVNKSCPYFTEMGLKHIKDMKQGDIDIYTYGDSDLKVAVEYAESKVAFKKSNKYFCFDSPSLKMISSGAWETALYPHCPCKYKPKDIKFIFFIIWEEEILQCEVVKAEGNRFIYVHRKTTPIKNEKKDLIYSREHSFNKNWRRDILKPTNDREKRIYQLFASDKVFYQDNEIGEIVRNYVVSCKKGS